LLAGDVVVLARNRHHFTGALMPSYADDRHFAQLIKQANATTIQGWHFSFLKGRRRSTPLPWNYEQLAAGHVESATRVLDVDTGGGEILARLTPPSGSIAVEDWSTNIPIAAACLEPMGVSVRQRVGGELPVGDISVDVVLNRHGDLDLEETARVLRPGGVLVSQQVAMENESEIGEAFGVQPTMFPNAIRDRADLALRVKAAGLIADLSAEAVIVSRYLDIGALVLQLRAVPLQVPGFSTDDAGSFDVHSKRLLLLAHRAN